MLTSPKALIRLQKVMRNYAKVFDIDKKNDDDRQHTFQENLQRIYDVVMFFNDHEEQAFARTGKRNTNGPDMTVSRRTRQSFTIVLESVTNVSNVLTEVGQEDLLEEVKFGSLTTLSVEGFFKGMRADQADRVCSDEGLTLETSAKHHIPQATNIPYQPC